LHPTKKNNTFGQIFGEAYDSFFNQLSITMSSKPKKKVMVAKCHKPMDPIEEESASPSTNQEYRSSRSFMGMAAAGILSIDESSSDEYPKYARIQRPDEPVSSFQLDSSPVNISPTLESTSTTQRQSEEKPSTNVEDRTVVWKADENSSITKLLIDYTKLNNSTSVWDLFRPYVIRDDEAKSEMTPPFEEKK
jgi:hypothetical protein